MWALTRTDFASSRTTQHACGHACACVYLQVPPWRIRDADEGSGRVSIRVEEFLNAAQYGRRDVADRFEAFGTVTCRVRLPPTR